MHSNQGTEPVISGPVGGEIVTCEPRLASWLGVIAHFLIIGAVVAAVALVVTR